MKISYIRFSKKKPERMLMKHLRDDNQNKWKHEKRFHENFKENNFDNNRNNFNKINYKTIRDNKRENEKNFSNSINYRIKNINESLKSLFQNNRKNKNQTYRVSFGVNKNRVALVAVSLMLVTASYMNYLNRTKLKIAELGDATFVSANAIIGDKETQNEVKENKVENNTQDNKKENSTENIVETASTTSEATNNKENKVNAEENKTQVASSNENNSNSQENIVTKEVSSEAEIESKNYFTKLRLDREKTYSQMIDNYNQILEKNNVSDEQKNVAVDGIKQINDTINSITTIENLLRGKGFADVVVLVNDNNTNVIVKSNEELKPEQIAQIEDIVSRELNLEIEKIHIINRH